MKITYEQIKAKQDELQAMLDAELAADPQPVGVYLGKKDDDCGEREECLTWNPIPVGTKLYTAPPSREWKGLSDDERQSC